MGRARAFGNIRQLPSGRFQGRYWHLGNRSPALSYERHSPAVIK